MQPPPRAAWCAPILESTARPPRCCAASQTALFNVYLSVISPLIAISQHAAPLPARRALALSSPPYNSLPPSISMPIPLLHCPATPVDQATFDGGRAAEAARKRHSTVNEALGVARDAGVRYVILTHFSQRYHKVRATGAWAALHSRTPSPAADAGASAASAAGRRRTGRRGRMSKNKLACCAAQ